MEVVRDSAGWPFMDMFDEAVVKVWVMYCCCFLVVKLCFYSYLGFIWLTDRGKRR